MSYLSQNTLSQNLAIVKPKIIFLGQNENVPRNKLHLHTITSRNLCTVVGPTDYHFQRNRMIVVLNSMY